MTLVADLGDGRPVRSWARHRLALVVDPRFPGGTSGAVAAEISVLGKVFDLAVYGIETAMFQGRQLHPGIAAALETLGLELVWSPPVVHADTVVFHNPSALRFDRRLATRLSCAQAFVVTHENFLRPTGAEGFDVAGCLAAIEAALICGQRRLAPVSRHNRRTIQEWLRQEARDWELTATDWTNVLDLEPQAPRAQPRDRRGRHSRAGLEKFPPLEVMLRHFPPHAEACIILGGDRFLADPETVPKHWDVRRFGATDVADFLSEIDFFVYFTHPLWRESFGRVVVEAIAAGKVVITDPSTAGTFGDAVVASEGDDVDRLVAGFVAAPEHYAAFVRRAQTKLAAFRPEPFVNQVMAEIEMAEAAGRAVV